MLRMQTVDKMGRARATTVAKEMITVKINLCILHLVGKNDKLRAVFHQLKYIVFWKTI